MNTSVRRGAFVVVLVLSAACGKSGPTAPSRGTPPAAVSQPAPAPPASDFPAAVGPSRTFVFDHELDRAVSDYTKTSRFVLYDNGAFVLQFPGIGEYRGRCAAVDGVISFEWQGWTDAGPSGATGTLTDDSLVVHYNLIMELSDFEDAAYKLTDPQ
jgi:hypothetical protein